MIQQLGYGVSGNNGILGIADGSGNYVYYKDYASAMASAKNGDTIVQFANIVEYRNAPIILKNGVNINMNGFSFEMKNPAPLGAIILPRGSYGNLTCSIMNGTIKNTNASVYALCLDSFTFGFTGTQNITTNCNFIGNSYMDSWNGVITFIGGTFTGNVTWWTAGNLNNAYVSGTLNFIPYGNITYGNNCIAGGGIVLSNGYGGSPYLNNCVGISSTTYGINSIGGYTLSYINNCIGISTGTYGFNSQNTRITNCSFISTASGGMGATTAGNTFYNTFVYSSAGSALTGGNGLNAFYNSTLISATNPAIDSNTPSNTFINSTIDCQWNSSLGHAVQNATSVIKCFIKVANPNARCLNATSTTNTTYLKIIPDTLSGNK